MRGFLAIPLALIVCLALAPPVGAQPAPLTPATPIDLMNDTGTVSGDVSTGHLIFSFPGMTGQIVTLDINVTEIRPGTGATDDDSELFLFNEAGNLLAANDDQSDDNLQSLISDFALPSSGTFFVGVTTFNNNPIITDGVISGWEDDGESNIGFDLAVTIIPEPGSLMLLAGGAALALARRRR